jgi:molybdopterin/thiamine biosynthesis adenylyltransferase
MVPLAEELNARAEPRGFPDGAGYRSLAAAAAQEIAGRRGLPLRAVEAAALADGIVPERYARNMRSFAPADQARLLGASAGIVGLGGLGGTVTEILARAGVGRLVLVDGDRFEASNLNRQLLSSVGGLGRSKAEAAERRVAEINPAVEVAAHREFLTADNAEALLAGCGVVVDCLDNLPARFALEDGCRRLGCPLVTAAVAGASGHVMTVYPEDRGLRLVYGEPQHLPPKGAETALGTLPFAVFMLAAIEGAEAVKALLGRGRALRNRLLLADLMDGVVDVIHLG